MIREVKQYVDDDEKRVTEYSVINNVNSDVMILNSKMYEGTVGLNTPQGVMPFSFEFPAGYTLEQCFEKFDDTAKEAVDKFIKERQEQSRIITPGQANMPKNIKLT